MHKINFKITIKLLQNILFFAGLTGILFYLSAHYSSLIVIQYKSSMILAKISLIILIIKILITKDKIWKYFLYAILIFISYKCDCIINIPFHMSFIIIPIIASKNINTKVIIRYMLFYNIILLTIQIFCYIMHLNGVIKFSNIEEKKIFYRYGHIRHTFFFFHPNTFSNYLFWTYMMFAYLDFNSKKMRKYIVVIAVLLSIFVFLYSMSKNASVFFLISIVFFYIFHNVKIQNNQLFQYLNVLLFSICLFVSFLFLFNYGKKGIFGTIINSINSVTSGRIKLGHDYFFEYGVNVFGMLMTNTRNLSAANVESVVIDNWYYYMVIRLGLVFTFFYFILFLISSYKFIQNKNFDKLYVITIFLLYNCIESVGINPQLAFPYFFFGIFI